MALPFFFSQIEKKLSIREKVEEFCKLLARLRAGEKTRQLIAQHTLTALPEDPRSVPSTHIRRFTTTIIGSQLL